MEGKETPVTSRHKPDTASVLLLCRVKRNPAGHHPREGERRRLPCTYREGKELLSLSALERRRRSAAGFRCRAKKERELPSAPDSLGKGPPQPPLSWGPKKNKASRPPITKEKRETEPLRAEGKEAPLKETDCPVFSGRRAAKVTMLAASR